MPDPDVPPSGDKSFNERIVEVVLYVPAGIAASLGEELPKLATRGRDVFEVRVSSARAVGELVVKAGADELKRRSANLLGNRSARVTKPAPDSSSSSASTGGATEAPGTSGSAGAGVGTVRIASSTPAADRPRVTNRPPESNGHVPEVSTLSIPGFDSLSASQVVQRLDGLNRTELVSVRAYEASTRGRRTILNRVDQLLDERS